MSPMANATMRRMTLDRSRIVRAQKTDEASGKTATDDAAPIKFEGHAAVFDQATLIGSRSWGFVEWLAPGAFSDVLENDVRFLFNHDGIPLARTTNGTLRLGEDDAGLTVEADLAPVTLSRDLATLIERGDVSQMSFAFIPGQERFGTVDLSDPKAAGHDGIDIPQELDGLPYSVVTKMGQLFDVSAVTYPAYEGTDAALASAVRKRADKIHATVVREVRYSNDYLQRKLALAKSRALQGGK